MKTVRIACLLCFIYVAHVPVGLAQGNERLVLTGLDLYKGIGTYTAITYGAGLNATYHKPLNDNFVLIGKAGLNFYRASFYNVGTGFGYTGNPTQMYPGQFYTTYDETTITGVSLPVSVGLRKYLPSITKGAHADAGIGAQFGIHNYTTAFLFTPSVGYMLSLPGGHYIDLNLVLLTKLARGGTVIGLGAAWALPR